jgi:PST family polysaccharide transporter
MNTTESYVKATGRQFAHALAWTALAKWSVQIVSWASLLIVARLLSPSDFGLVGMATAYLGLVTLLTEFGLGTTILTLRDLNERQVAQLNGVALLIGAGGVVVSLALAHPIAAFFRTPAVAPVVMLMSITFLISAARSVPYAVLQKKLMFRTISVLEAGQVLVQAAVIVALASWGAGYWSLAWGGIAGAISGTLPLFVIQPCGLQKPRFSALGETLRFSRNVVVARLSWYLYSNADFVVAGRTLGTAALGAYTFAWNFANMPGEKTTSLVLRVSPAFFGAAQKDHAQLRRYLTVLTEAMALFMFPVIAGLSVTADDLVVVAFGPQWIDAVMPLRILTLYAFVRSVVALLPQILNVVGGSTFWMWNSLTMLALLPPSFYLGSRWGVTGIAAVWVLVYQPLTIPLYYRTLRGIGLSFREYMRTLIPGLAGSGTMVLAVLAVKSAAASWEPLPRLTIQFAAGGLVYAAVMWFGYRDRLAAYSDFYSRLRSQTP